ncbi:MAG: WalW protein, partial [Alphaproteobacteria bacterium]|nr:WalW protein [Alphaproteobacteria bacterium]
RVLTFSFHSPSVAPGFTPYVRTDEDRDAFLALFDDYFRFFRDELEGEFTTPLRVHEQLVRNQPT